MKDRLRKGAKMLGNLWRSGDRCQNGWMPACNCTESKQFCTVKRQWTALAEKVGRVAEPDRMIFEAMTAGELYETGLTIKLDNGVELGPKGIPLPEAAGFIAEPDSVPAVLKVLARFPGAKVARTT